MRSRVFQDSGELSSKQQDAEATLSTILRQALNISSLCDSSDNLLDSSDNLIDSSGNLLDSNGKLLDQRYRCLTED